MTIPPGWTSINGELSDWIDFSRGTDEVLTILHVTRVWDSQGAPTVETVPADLDGWIRTHPRLRITSERQVGLAGQTADEFTASVTSGESGCSAAAGPCFEFFAPTSHGPFSLVVGNENRIDVVSVAGSDVVVTLEAPPGAFDAFQSAADGLLASLSFNRS
jgi:hypothetical protein